MRTKAALTILLALSIPAGLGCASRVISPEGNTAATYRFGKLTDTLPADISTAYNASMEAVQGLGLNVIESEHSQLQGKILARTSQDKKVVIDLTSITEKATSVTIDTGALSSASRVYRAIMKNLGAATSAPTP